MKDLGADKKSKIFNVFCHGRLQVTAANSFLAPSGISFIALAILFVFPTVCA
jgi:hypothetical protein